MFALNEKVVYPGHGVAKISRIIERTVDGCKLSFFELKFLDSDMTILVPTSNLHSIGIRKVCSNEIVDEIFKRLSASSSKNHAEGATYCGSNWGKRLKKYQGKISTGDPLKICDIYRDLKCLSTQKELSFGEKNLLQKIEHLLAQEISIANNINEEQALLQLRTQCKTSKSVMTS